ncbi:MAG: T9SS type A sorting domain-containing protein [Chlorobi bacterium]|nr:T9SS type A sorting domain-containing protein [Chlorobiota bacterium]
MKSNSYKTVLFVLSFFFFSFAYCQIVVNEYSASNLSAYLDNHNHHEDWIELYNTGNSTVSLAGYYLSDNPNNLMKYQIPAGISINANSYKTFWLSGRNIVEGNNIHTNFKLTQTKDNPDHVILSDAFGTVLDDQELQVTQKDHSRGRTTDGANSWSIFTNSTKGNSNGNSTPYSAYTQKPSMSTVAGFYDGAISVSISTTEPNVTVRYTTNGDKPTTSSPEFENPINVSSTMIINARAFSSSSLILPGLIDFNTYFINESHTLAIMSCSDNQLDNLLNGNQSLAPFGTFEYFNKEGIRTNIGYGEFNEHGQDSWVHDQRSIDYISRDECGYNYAIREQLMPAYTDRDEFQRVILRAAGDDNYPGIDTSALLRDFFVQNLATKSHMKLDCRKGEKGLLYVNGTYWGVYGYREKVSDHDYTKYYYDQGKFDIQFLKLWGGTWAEYGGQQAFTDWNALHDFIKFNNMADDENYDYVTSQLDVSSLVDYILINSFVVCSDWINWNVGWWRGLDPEGQHKKWAYILWDEDATFAHYINYTGVPEISPTAAPCYPEGLTSDPEEHIVMLNHLLDNPDFNQYYLSRYVDLMNTAFRPDYMIGLLDSIHDGMAPEMPQHVARWGGSISEWENNVQKIRNFINTRVDYIPTGFEDCWDLTGPYDVVFDVEPAGKGNIQANSLLLKDFPWNGEYYDGVNTLLSAIVLDPDYEFDYWEVENNTVLPSATVPNVNIMIEEGDNIIAHFKLKEFTDSLVINEINYNSANNFDTRDWVEFYNPHDYSLDIAGWVFKDDNDNHIFEFPTGTSIGANEFLVLVRDSTTFSTFFPNVENYIGQFDFGLNNGGELIRLYDVNGALVDTVHYDNQEPWPTAPDGTGPTLELLNPGYDNALAESWAASLEHGTPGEENSMITAIPEQMVQEVSFRIYPNPFNSTATLQFTSGQIPEGGHLAIFNIFGKEVKRIDNIQTDRIVISRDNLQTGVYFCALFDKSNNRIGEKKLVVQ